MSVRVFQERSIVFQSMDQVKRYDDLSLFNEHGDLYFFHCMILVNKLSLLNWGN